LVLKDPFRFPEVNVLSMSYSEVRKVLLRSVPADVMWLLLLGELLLLLPFQFCGLVLLLHSVSMVTPKRGKAKSGERETKKKKKGRVTGRPWGSDREEIKKKLQ